MQLNVFFGENQLRFTLVEASVSSHLRRMFGRPITLVSFLVAQREFTLVRNCPTRIRVAPPKVLNVDLKYILFNDNNFGLVSLIASSSNLHWNRDGLPLPQLAALRE